MPEKSQYDLLFGPDSSKASIPEAHKEEICLLQKRFSTPKETQSKGSKQEPAESEAKIGAKHILANYKSKWKKTQITLENKGQVLEGLMQPLAELPRDQQRDLKKQNHRKVLYILRRYGMVNIHTKDVITLPEEANQRTEVEFCIGQDFQGAPGTVGFLVKDHARRTMVCVEPPGSMSILERRHIELAKMLQCVARTQGEALLGLKLKSNEEGQVLASVKVDTHLLDKENLDVLLRNVIETLSQHPDLHSLYYENSEGDHIGLYGQQFLNVNGCRVGPEVMMTKQTSYIMDVLATFIKETCPIQMDALVHYRCGSGNYTRNLAPLTERYFGLDLDAHNIKMARLNHEGEPTLNFACGEFMGATKKVFDFLGQTEIQSGITCLFTPPYGSSLSKEVIESLKTCPAVNQMLYMTQKPHGDAMNNLKQMLKVERKKSRYNKSPLGNWKLVSSAIVEKPDTVDSDHIFLLVRDGISN